MLACKDQLQHHVKKKPWQAVQLYDNKPTTGWCKVVPRQSRGVNHPVMLQVTFECSKADGVPLVEKYVKGCQSVCCALHLSDFHLGSVRVSVPGSAVLSQCCWISLTRTADGPVPVQQLAERGVPTMWPCLRSTPRSDVTGAIKQWRNYISQRGLLGEPGTPAVAACP